MGRCHCVYWNLVSLRVEGLVRSWTFSKNHADAVAMCHTLKAENEKLRAALAPFRFVSSPNEFQSDDGGCTEAIICDADVQAARAALTETE